MIGFGSGLAPTLISTVVSHANPFIKLPPIFALLVATLFFAATSFAQLTPPKLDIPYGHNSAAGKFAEVNGINLYYETYGSSRPMLQIHGNGDSIAGMGHQIKFFSTHYRVIAADSHFRYLSGLLFGIGILFWQAIPAIETKTAQVRLLCVPIVIGGCARLAAALFVAVPPLGMLFAIGMELLVTPGLCLWQARIARIAREQICVDGERKNIK